MNVKLNKRLQEAEFLEKTYFMPSCGDESNVVGAAFGACLRNAVPLTDIQPISTMYSGIRIEKKDVLEFIERGHLGEKYEIQDLDDDSTSAHFVA